MDSMWKCVVWLCVALWGMGNLKMSSLCSLASGLTCELFLPAQFWTPKNLLALLVQLLVRLTVWIQKILFVLWSSCRCFGAASGEPSIQVWQIEIYSEICLGEEIWSLGKWRIQSEFWKLTPAPSRCGLVSSCSDTYMTYFDLCTTLFFKNSDHIVHFFVQPQTRLLSSWEFPEDILPSV